MTKGKPLLPFERYQALSARDIQKETCEKYGYFIGREDNDKLVQTAPYRDQDGRVVAQKVRRPGKKFYTTGDFDPKELQLFGQHLWRKGGKRVLVVEGEIDALSGQQMLGSWPVVSIPNGAQGAVQSFKTNIQWLESYATVVIGFDQDEEGTKAAEECARLLTPGKAAIMSLPVKDTNEMLQEGRVREFVSAFWEAQEYRPDGLVTVDDIMDEAMKPTEWGLPWVYPTLTNLTYGRREGEVYGLGAGTGVGKTDVFTEQMAYDIVELDQKIGVLALEQMPKETSKRLAGKIAERRFHIPDAEWTTDELREALEQLRDHVTFYDNFGSTDWNIIKGLIRFMAVSQGIKLFYLDHLTALADKRHERESLEEIMEEMSMLANELGIIIHYISHLATPEGKPHEEGGRVAIRHFKGSRAIGFWSYFLFGLERNQQAKDEEERHTTRFRVLKDRYTGQATGEVFFLKYDAERGKLVEAGAPEGLLDDDEDDDY